MRRVSFCLFVLSFLFTSCIFISKSKEAEKENQSQEQNEIENSSNNTFVNIINDSDFTICLYSDPTRTHPEGAVSRSENIKLSCKPSTTGTVFYITYYIDIGVPIPWYDNNCFIVTTPKLNETVSANVKNPSTIKTDNAFILLENDSDSSIILKRGSSIELFPLEKDTSILNSKESGVYEIPYNSFSGFSVYNLYTTQGEKIPFPSNFTQLESGNIYSVSIYQNSLGSIVANLKYISPLDIDTQKQIWSFSDNSFNPEYPCILRNSYNNDGTNLIMGTTTANATSIGYKIIDKYNSESKLYSFTINQDQEDPVISRAILDFVQIDDGSIVMLLENTYKKTDNSKYKSQFIYSLDFEKQELKNWSYKFPEQMVFRADSKNKFICTQDGKLAIAGAVLRNTQMHKYFAILDISNQIPSGNSYISSDSTNWKENIETMFTSIWYDGTNFFVCGYDNWDIKYSELSHKGIVYKFSPDFSEKEEIYSHDRALFFCIDGSDNNWYACGEYADNGKILKGCYISKKMADEGKTPVKYVTYSTNRSYCYFTQLCCYQNKIIIAGRASDSFDESENPLPIIVAFDKASDEILWENTNFTSYNNINAIIPNKIGTYVVQLQSDSHFHYVSADLLGNEKL